MQEIQILRDTIEAAYDISLHIPEFEPWYPMEKWKVRCDGKQVIALIAKVGDAVVGCKVGYFEDDQFYSWVGGVLPAYRRRGVAEKLADMQEELVRNTGVHRIRMKTRNRFREMLHFALNRGFYIADVEQKGEPGEWRITLYKNV